MNRPSESEIIPCPFCGETIAEPKITRSGSWLVQCPCAIRLIKEEAIEAWNKRNYPIDSVGRLAEANNQLEIRNDNLHSELKALESLLNTRQEPKVLTVYDIEEMVYDHCLDRGLAIHVAPDIFAALPTQDEGFWGRTASRLSQQNDEKDQMIAEMSLTILALEQENQELTAKVLGMSENEQSK